ncbi:MAG: helix-turn-helix transcriptional regulator [Candidatus Aminicenantes bacterium]|nr:MAG: helix-turn-helix transcriptional regulator [Candidatus Aminicenantes bacterium]
MTVDNKKEVMIKMPEKRDDKGSKDTAPYLDIGIHTKAAREALGKTIQGMSDATGISRGYISDFERGVKLPTARYIKYLYDKCNINVNYIFSGEGLIFRPVKGKALPLDFGSHQGEVEELVWFMYKVPHALLYQLQAHLEYKLKYKQMLSEHFPEIKKELL